MRVVAALDKFRGTVTAAEAVQAVAAGVLAAGGTCDGVPVADGGEGTLEALGGANRTTLVNGPLGDGVQAGWRMQGRTAIIEMARASGLDLVGGAEGNDAMAASTYGTGELISAALDAGARRIIVGLGGSATTDGGLGAQRAIAPLNRLKPVELLVACDVRTRFTDAAAIFGPQKGATPAQVKLLTRRLERLAEVYFEEFRIDVTDIEGSGAAGGLAGGLVAIGGRLVPGFELIADEVDLAERIADADLVITGEGHLDAQSFDGKVVGGVAALAAQFGKPVVALAGLVDVDEVGDRIRYVSLVDRFGDVASTTDTARCLTEVARELATWRGAATS